MVSTNDEKLSLALQSRQFEFPDELLFDVFLSLPAKSLYRFRSVSKGMRRIIDSSIFITKYNIRRSVKLSAIAAARSHLIDSSSYSDDNNDEDYAALLLQSRTTHRFLSVKFDDSLNLNLNKAIRLDCNLVRDGRYLKGWGCHGIFCFLGVDPHHYLFWNPSNATFRKVDCSSFPTFRDVSMGYDIVNDDYKIIGFVNKDASAMQVYSLRNDSWKKLSHNHFPSGRACLGLTQGVCVGGIMHWMWTTGNGKKSIFIVAFNLATETFACSLPLPSEARHLQLNSFFGFRDRLCVTFVPPGTYGPHTIWLMRKYGVESTWSRLYNFVTDNTYTIRNYYFPSGRCRFLCYWRDPQEGGFERFEIPGLLDPYACVFVRNLVRLDQSLV